MHRPVRLAPVLPRALRRASPRTTRALGPALCLLIGCSGASATQGGGGAGSSSNGGEATGAGPNGEGTPPNGGTTELPDGAVVPATMGADGGTVTTLGPDGGAGPLTLPPPGPRFPVVAMHLVPQPGASGADARVDLELRADGTIYSHGQLVGQLAGDRVLATDGREMLAVSPDGVVALQGRVTAIRLTDAGEIVNPRGGVMRVGDDGTPLTQPAPNAPATRGALVFGGFRPDARRTAALLALLVATTQLP